MADFSDSWKEGVSYENFMGRWSRRLAPKYVDWLKAPSATHWLDVGCGTGALAEAICKLAKPASVVGCDPAAPFIEYARQHFQNSRLNFVTAGTGDLPGRPGGYDCIASLLALNFFPDPKAAIREMRSLAAPGGMVSTCVWDYKQGIEFLRYFWDAVTTMDLTAHKLDEGDRFPICNPEKLQALFRQAELLEICCEPVEIETNFSGFDDYWQPFLGGTGPAPSYVATLDPGQRSRLKHNLEKSLPQTAIGTIALTARAWAIQGRAD